MYIIISIESYRKFKAKAKEILSSTTAECIIPSDVLETIARCVLPDIVKYYEEKKTKGTPETKEPAHLTQEAV